MLNIDIDACLAQDTPDEFDIKIQDETLFPDESPILTCRLSYADFKKLYAQHYKPKMTSGRGKRDSMEIEIVGSDYDFGLKLAESVIGWSGFTGAFDRDKLLAFFKRFPTVCEAFGNGAGGVYKAKDAKFMKYQRDAEKN